MAMHVAVTGATGFLGRYIVKRLTAAGHRCRCWYRPESDRGGFDAGEEVGRAHPTDIGSLDWVPGDLIDAHAADALLEGGVDAIVHSALHHPGGGFRGGEGDLVDFVTRNIVGTIRLIETARRMGVGRFVFIATCAVHEVILDDRPLDEAHPLWPTSHYGAHKAAIEKFVHSYGLGEKYDICSLRPTGIHGLARPIEQSKWYGLVRDVQAGRPIRSDRGGKEVHAVDVAKAVEILLTADGIAGQAYNCYDMYIADQDVADIAKQITGSASTIQHSPKEPKHQIDTAKLRALGMTFGGRPLLERTVRELLDCP